MTKEKLTLAWRGNTARLPDVIFVEQAQPAPPVRAAASRVHVVHSGPGVQQDPVDLCLEMWKVWMTQAGDRDLGAKTMRGLSGEGDGHGIDLHEAQRACDMRMAEATDAMINSLSRLHVWAIYCACSLATVWKFPNASLADVAADARSELATKLRKNICTAVLF
jgi:hypothetical protein